MRAAVALCAGDTLTALETATRAEQRIRQRCVGARFELALARWLLCLALRRAGELERLAVCYETYLEEARRLGDHLAVMSLQTTCSIVWLARDDAQGGARQLGGLLESWPGEAFGLPHVAVRWAQIDHAIYEGRVEAAWKMASGERSPFENSLLRKSSLMREGSLLRRGRAALALAESTAQGSARPELLTQVADVVRSLGRETNASATAWASLMQAAASWLQSRDDRGAPVRQLNRAIAELETAGCQAMAAAARRRKGELLAGDEGDELVAAADRWLAGQGVKNPARFASLLAPGFGAG
jgi:hypothetical protein